MSTLIRRGTYWPGSKKATAHEDQDVSGVEIPVPPKIPNRLSKPGHLHNPYVVPTRAALEHSLVVNQRSIWDIYEGLEYSTNQGKDYKGRTIVSRKRNAPPEALSVIKQHEFEIKSSLASLTKPLNSSLVGLYQVFYDGTTLSIVYEEMDISLEQVLSLDVDPWAADLKDLQVGAMTRQVRYQSYRGDAC